ncbi:RBR-type E3 ubiquitin transferase [Heracleum sosnowskyi]|uniref:RBR-type E3 ubiquitin transferase n=1 Tax=Heracleum sosnowskyi TaxID=360622 RepID=A0AAD8ICA0_9APIA|nr:RBR-type E3 ubiquitin transferase [Heracleum sosnowskyi]
MDVWEDKPMNDDGLIDDNESMDENEFMDIDEYKHYRVLKRDDILKLQEDDITLLSSAISVSRTAAVSLLQHYAWNGQKAQDAWFDDEDGVRKFIGLMNRPAVDVEVSKSGELLVCGICFEFYVFDNRFECFDEFCGHSFCSACLEIYVSTAIRDGPGCLFLRCPDPTCRAVIGEDMVNLLVSDEGKMNYKEFLFRSYVENNKKIKWCPAPDCKYAIEYKLGSESYDVTCDCSLSFCWNCAEESHRPVRCETVKKWMSKNSSGIDNMTWIIANSKQCPKCNLAIQKSQGCMHMTCKPPCKHEFCWICLGPWDRHDTTACNRYRDIVEQRKMDDKIVRKKAKKYSKRYAHYYERWDANHHSRDRALADRHELRTKKLRQLEEKLCQTTARLKFIADAWEQIAECRRVLKWTYAYGYYIPKKASLRKELFEYLQGEAEVALERLHDCAENTLKQYFEPDGNTDEFDTKFRTKLVDLTRVTRNYFENFVKGVANGLSEVKKSNTKVGRKKH